MKVAVSKPSLSDIPAMRNLIMPEVQKGVILDRSEDEMATAIRSYSIIRVGGEIVAFSALHVHSMKLGEVRSLIVREDFRHRGLASLLIDTLLQEARSINLKEVLTLTYARELFEKNGFTEIAKEALPDHKIWTDCVKCTRFPVCDEIALIKTL